MYPGMHPSYLAYGKSPYYPWATHAFSSHGLAPKKRQAHQGSSSSSSQHAQQVPGGAQVPSSQSQAPAPAAASSTSASTTATSTAASAVPHNDAEGQHQHQQQPQQTQSQPQAQFQAQAQQMAVSSDNESVVVSDAEDTILQQKRVKAGSKRSHKTKTMSRQSGVHGLPGAAMHPYFYPPHALSYGYGYGSPFMPPMPMMMHPMGGNIMAGVPVMSHSVRKDYAGFPVPGVMGGPVGMMDGSSSTSEAELPTEFPHGPYTAEDLGASAPMPDDELKRSLEKIQVSVVLVSCSLCEDRKSVV